MSKNILNKLDELEQELNSLERNLLENKNKKTVFEQGTSSGLLTLQRQLKEEQKKSKKVNSVLVKNIEKLERIIEKEEKSNA